MLLKNLQNMKNKYILLILIYLLQFSSVMAFDYKPSDSTNIQTPNTLFTGTILEETNNNKLYAYLEYPMHNRLLESLDGKRQEM